MSRSINRFLFAAVFLLQTVSMNAQTDTAITTIRYKVEHVIDTGATPAQMKYDLLLFIGKQYAYSVSRNRYLSDSLNLVYQKMAASNPANAQYSSTAMPKRLSSIESLAVYYDYQKKYFYEVNAVGLNNFLMEDGTPPVWKIENMIEKLFGFDCQQATTVYKCRKWTVWFTTDFAAAAGPWKLSGLPGLILKATDDRNEVSIVFDGMEVRSQPATIELKKARFIKCSKAEYFEQLRQYATDPIRYIETQMGINLFSGDETRRNPVPLKLPTTPLDRCRN